MKDDIRLFYFKMVFVWRCFLERDRDRDRERKIERDRVREKVYIIRDNIF